MLRIFILKLPGKKVLDNLSNQKKEQILGFKKLAEKGLQVLSVGIRFLYELGTFPSNPNGLVKIREITLPLGWVYSHCCCGKRKSPPTTIPKNTPPALTIWKNQGQTTNWQKNATPTHMKTKNSSYSIPVMLMLMLAWPHVGTTVISELKHPNLLDETFQPGLT